MENMQKEYILKSDFEAVRSVLAEAKAALVEKIGADKTAEIELCLAEALNNVVEHAYPERPNGQIRMSVEVSDANVDISIEDKGEPMPEGKRDFEPNPDFDDPERMAEGGYGRTLILMLMSNVTYERLGDTNKLSMRKCLT